MKKKLCTLFLVICMLTTLLMTGCGGSSSKEKSPYAGNWIAVSAQMMGMSVDIEETLGGTIEFEVKNNGKADISLAGDTGTGKWSVEEDEFTLIIDDEKTIGVIGEDTITFDNMLDMGVKLIFAKEGTDAMNPELYMTEEEALVLGEWMSETVEELLGDGPQTTMEGVDDIHDGLRLNFKNDKTVVVSFKGQEIGTFPWNVAFGYCTIDTENPFINVVINEDDTLEVDYSIDEEYYTFHCIRNGSEAE